MSGLDAKPVNCIATKNDTPNTTLFVGTGRSFSAQYGGLFKKDGTEWQWTEVAPGVFDGKVVRSIAIDPLNPEIMLVGTDKHGMFRSLDGGLSWEAINDGLNNSPLLAIAFNPQNTSQVFCGCEGTGFFHSVDRGSFWHSSSRGINMLCVTDVAVDPSDPENIYASFTGTNSGGVFISNDGGGSWYIAKNLVNQRCQAIAIDPRDTQNIYAAMEGPVTYSTPEGIYRSSDGGQTWQFIGPTGVYPPHIFDYSIYKIAVNPNQGSWLLLGIQAVRLSGLPSLIFCTIDGGQNWNIVYQGCSTGLILDLAFDFSDPLMVYAAETCINYPTLGGVLKSTNGGISWFYVNNGLPNKPSCLSVCAAGENTVYATLRQKGIYKSADGGASWQPTNFPITNWAYSVMAHPFDKDEVFASTDALSIGRSLKGGVDFKPFYLGYPAQQVLRFWSDRNENDPHLYACGFRGLYYMDLNEK
jgi:photosystem II stability/assembly factor-like uncharacterized protein